MRCGLHGDCRSALCPRAWHCASACLHACDTALVCVGLRWSALVFGGVLVCVRVAGCMHICDRSKVIYAEARDATVNGQALIYCACSRTCMHMCTRQHAPVPGIVVLCACRYTYAWSTMRCACRMAPNACIRTVHAYTTCYLYTRTHMHVGTLAQYIHIHGTTYMYVHVHLTMCTCCIHGTIHGTCRYACTIRDETFETTDNINTCRSDVPYLRKKKRKCL